MIQGEAQPRGSGQAVIRLLDVVKIYGKNPESQVLALDGVSFEVQAGEMVAIMGSSGSGKSTLMNIIGCLDRPTSGTYLLDGEDVSRLSRDRLAEIRNQRLGFVFQNFNLLPRTTALENVEIPLVYGTLNSSLVARRARECLSLVGLSDREHHIPSQLSGGQQQRVAIARALVNRPSLLLADEPTGNLDSRTSIEIMQLFQKLNDDGMTIVLITHEADIAESAQRIVVLRDGRIIEDRPVLHRRNAGEELTRIAAGPAWPGARP